MHELSKINPEVKKKSLALKPLKTYSPKSLKIAAIKSGFEQTLVADVAHGIEEPFRALHEPSAIIQLMGIIKEVAEVYGARQSISEEVLTACLEIFMSNFSAFGVHEVKRAYMLWATGKLQLEGEAEMWGGEFNARNFSAVMTAYSKHRWKIAAQLQREQEEAIKENEAERKQKEFDKNFIGLVAEWEGQTWEDVPANWYDAAIRLELIEAPNKRNYGPYWTKAIEAAKREFSSRYTQAEAMERRKMNSLKESYIEIFAKPIARKMWVYDHLLKTD